MKKYSRSEVEVGKYYQYADTPFLVTRKDETSFWRIYESGCEYIQNIYGFNNAFNKIYLARPDLDKLKAIKDQMEEILK